MSNQKTLLIAKTASLYSLIHLLKVNPSIELVGIIDPESSQVSEFKPEKLTIHTMVSIETFLKDHKDLLVIDTVQDDNTGLVLEKNRSLHWKLLDEEFSKILISFAEEQENIRRFKVSQKLSKQYSVLMEETNKLLDEKLIELSLLNEISIIFNGSMDPLNVLTQLFDIIVKKIPKLDSLFLILPQDDKLNLIVTSNSKLSEDYVDIVKSKIVDKHINSHPIFFNKEVSISFCPSLSFKDDYTHSHDKECVLLRDFELVTLKKTIGFFGLTSNIADFLKKDDEKFFITVVGQLITFLENVQSRDLLYKEKMALESQKQELERINKELDAFAYTISHDLRAPLRTIISFSGMIKQNSEKELNAKSLEDLDRIIANGRKMNDLMAAIIEFTMIGRIEKNKENINVEEIIKDVLSFMEADIKEKKAEIIIESRFPDIECYKERVSQIFINLIGNALKYVPKEAVPQIRIGCENKNDTHWFYVKDNGIGIKKEFQEKIFGIFSRLHTDKSKYSGSGIGLSNVKKIIEIHNGQLYLESDEGKGTAFYFTLEKEANKKALKTIEDSKHEDSEEKDVHQGKQDLSHYPYIGEATKHLLVVDDDPDSLEVFKTIVENSKVDYTVSYALSGEEAINYVLGKSKYSNREEYPVCDGMLLDINMPKISGYDVLEIIRKDKRFKKLPIISMFTSSSSPEDRKKADKLGADFYITKDESDAELVRKIEEMMQKAETIHAKL